MKTKHTPTPWEKDATAHQGEHSQRIKLGPAASDTQWGWIIVEGAKAKANTEFLLRAVNSHDEMLAQLNKLHDSMHRIKNEGLRYICDVNPASCEMRTVIAKAEGEVQP